MSYDRPTQDHLHAMFDYDPAEGFVRWKDAPYVRRKLRGRIAGYDGENMTILVRIDDRVYPVHHIVYCYVTGDWPTRQVRHHNKNKHDNRWENLYLAGAKRPTPQNSSPPWE